MEDESPDDGEALSWRQDPEKSLSDWTIVVKTETGVSTYHTHKLFLLLGLGLASTF